MPQSLVQKAFCIFVQLLFKCPAAVFGVCVFTIFQLLVTDEPIVGGHGKYYRIEQVFGKQVAVIKAKLRMVQ